MSIIVYIQLSKLARFACSDLIMIVRKTRVHTEIVSLTTMQLMVNKSFSFFILIKKLFCVGFL